MSKKFLWAGLVNAVLLASWAGCSSSSGGGTTTGTTTHTTTSSSSGTASSSSGTGTGGGTTTSSFSSSSGSSSSSSSGTAVPFQCTVPSTPPSTGSCVTTVAANDAGTGVECNPVTNGGCTGSDACDVNVDENGDVIGFVCYSPEGSAFTDTLCAACDNTTDATSCPAGQTCLPYDQAGDSACAQYCCSDADCGSGKCTTMGSSGAIFGSTASNLGICTLQ